MSDAASTEQRRTLPLYKRGRSAAETIEIYSIPEPNSGCWIWTGAAAGGRYGSVCINSKRQKAHRVSWEAHKGPIPDGLHVLHRCDNTLCVNPDHLFVGTHKDNMEDKEKKGRGNHAKGQSNGLRQYYDAVRNGTIEMHHTSPEKRRGVNNGRAVLSEMEAMAIRYSKSSNGFLAKLYGVTKTTIRSIKRKRIWAHL